MCSLRERWVRYGRDPTPPNTTDSLGGRDLLGGLIHEYEAAA
jgi:hypothetical protein